jgi:hypothetical protein
MDKEIRIFDTANNILKVKGIRFELFEVGTGVLLDTKNSDNLNPTLRGSNEWGVKLSFSPSSGPLEVYTSDPSHRYPGNTIRSLEGQNDNRIDVDLSRVPATAGGQATPLSSTNPAAVTAWVQSSQKWTHDEKQAVLNFVNNYLGLIAERNFVDKKHCLEKLVKNWELELKRLRVEIKLD